jgi:hypothetical protein
MDEPDEKNRREALEAPERLRDELAEILADLLIQDLKQDPGQSAPPVAS